MGRPRYEHTRLATYYVYCMQDTSVLSPMVSVTVQVPVVAYLALLSSDRLLNTHCVLFMTAYALPIVKSIIHMMVGKSLVHVYVCD